MSFALFVADGAFQRGRRESRTFYGKSNNAKFPSLRSRPPSDSSVSQHTNMVENLLSWKFCYISLNVDSGFLWKLFYLDIDVTMSAWYLLIFSLDQKRDIFPWVAYKRIFLKKLWPKWDVTRTPKLFLNPCIWMNTQIIVNLRKQTISNSRNEAFQLIWMY